MSFNSLSFIFIFLPLTLALYYVPGLFPHLDKHKLRSYREVLLVILSLFFYAWGDVKFLPLLLLMILVNYGLLSGWIKIRFRAEQQMSGVKTRTIASAAAEISEDTKSKAKAEPSSKISQFIFTLGVLLNIAVLAWGKYFCQQLPLGLSFYVFKILSSWFDVRKSLEAFLDGLPLVELAKLSSSKVAKLSLPEVEANFSVAQVVDGQDEFAGQATDKQLLAEFKQTINFNCKNYLLYVSFFPELVSGPISRFKDFTTQIEAVKVDASNLYLGFKRFIPALFVKVVLADQIFLLRQNLLTDLTSIGAAEAWLASLYYTMYIYLDFATYSAMAVGLGEMLGFKVQENFNYPYAADSLTDFWRRWHMSLSFWFRDYVYIPLGGNRKGKARQMLNLTVVWLLTGIWHGSHLNFLFWGLFYAFILILEKLYFLDKCKDWPGFIKRVVTLFIVNLAWVLFAFPKFTELKLFLAAMFGANGQSNGHGLYSLTANVILLFLALLACTSLLSKLRVKWRNTKFGQSKTGTILEFVIYLLLFVLTVAFIEDQSFASFLYFQF